MPAYIVTIPADSNAPLYENKRSVALFAEDVAAAREAAAMAYNDFSPVGVPDYWAGLFAAGTVTEIAAGDLEGAVLRCQIDDPSTPVDVSVTGAASATIDSICALMVTALNNTAEIAGAAYSGSNLLTVAETTDNLGDNNLTVTLIHNGVDLQDLIGTITDGGAEGSALTVQMATDAIALPAVAAIL